MWCTRFDPARQDQTTYTEAAPAVCLSVKRSNSSPSGLDTRGDRRLKRKVVLGIGIITTVGTPWGMSPTNQARSLSPTAIASASPGVTRCHRRTSPRNRESARGFTSRRFSVFALVRGTYVRERGVEALCYPVTMAP